VAGFLCSPGAGLGADRLRPENVMLSWDRALLGRTLPIPSPVDLLFRTTPQ
jgi:hypothetical protein